jgi:hypothetical protein
MSRRRLIFSSIVLLATAASSVVAWIALRGPRPPDISRISIDEALAYMSTDPFNALSAAQRRGFAIATAERMREISFGQILFMMARNDPGREQRFRNLQAIPDNEPVSAAYMRVFLDKFYEESPLKQKVYLTTFAGLQQTEIARHPEQFGLPGIDQFKNDMGRFFANQPPRVQAQMGQFLIDLKKQRTAMGLKDPF